jgi:hypothetical protein
MRERMVGRTDAAESDNSTSAERSRELPFVRVRFFPFASVLQVSQKRVTISE